jgi:FkbM family methyltransferase
MASATTLFKDATKRMIRRLIPAHVRFQRAGREFLASGEREVHELPRLVEPGTAAIDVGSLIGDYAYSLCRHVGPAGLVVCVEPQPAYARLLRTAATRLKLPMQVVECALSSRPGHAELSVPVVDGHTLAGYASLDHGRSGGRTVRVELRRLDDVAAGITQRISFLKVDVEGHELEVFKGALETLGRHRPNLLVEIEQRHSPIPIAETFDFLRAQGYAGSYLDETGRRVPLETFDFRRNQELSGGERATGKPQPGYISNFIFTPV